MTFLRLCLFLTLLSVVLTNDVPINSETVKLELVKFLPYHGKYGQRLEELAGNLTRATEKEQVAILNDYVDEVISNVNEYIIANGLEPVELPGFEASFKWTIFTGWVIMDDGFLKGLSSFTRKGDVVVTYEYPNVKVVIPLSFSRITFGYWYEVKFMYLGPGGTADGKTDGNKFTVDLEMNMVTLRAKLNRFKLNTLGSVSLRFHGNILTDWMINLVLIAVMPILKPILGMVIEGFVVDGFEYIIEYYNNIICTILADCPQQLVETVYHQLQ